ncbi:anti-sigma factor family protein [Paludisphaera rhizosphaerae]|uniref:anti-sigma factor family protein n=1 Tax=Paludisphaera rhizosphaerae TaxID=2711216 RepID=UPI0013EBCFCE|nr:zf-HC2 domain-containing protein [Paludisphaera rhizosphaerae]
MPASAEPRQSDSVKHTSTPFETLEYLVFKESVEASDALASLGFCNPAIDRIRKIDAENIREDDVEWFHVHVEGGCPACAEALRRMEETLAADQGSGPKSGQDVANSQAGAPADCNTVKAQMSKYLDDSLEIQDRDNFNEHVRECRSCFDLVEKLEWTLYLAAAAFEGRPDAPREEESPEADPGPCDGPGDLTSDAARRAARTGAAGRV